MLVREIMVLVYCIIPVNVGVGGIIRILPVISVGHHDRVDFTFVIILDTTEPLIVEVRTPARCVHTSIVVELREMV